MLIDKDSDGFEVCAGDTVSFSFGIPPTRVEGVLFERNGRLMMACEGVTPKEATLAQIRRHTGGFWKVTRHAASCECPNCNTKANRLQA